MLFLTVVALALMTLRPAGGRFSVLAELPLRRWELVLAALLVQILVISVLVDPPHLLAATLHLLSYALAGGFLWANRSLRGLPVAAAGGGLNVLAIAANGGVMPATESALRSAGLSLGGDHFVNSAAVDEPRLALLGDVFFVPASVGPLANVFSIGDVVLAAGVLLVVHAGAACPWTSWSPRRLRPAVGA